MKDYMLTTVNNPFNPFKEFDEWYNHDVNVLGYDTCGKLARIAKTTNALSDDMNEEETLDAMDVLIESAPALFVRVERSTADEVIKQFTKAN